MTLGNLTATAVHTHVTLLFYNRIFYYNGPSLNFNLYNMQLTLIKQVPRSADVTSFYFKPPQAVNYDAGQYFRWLIFTEPMDSRGPDRFFTISSSPTEPDIMLTTKFYPKPSTFKQHLRDLKVGDTIEVNGPNGTFTLPESTDQPIVLVAGGIGVTPFRSMLKYVFDKKLDYKIHLIHAAKTSGELIFKDGFDEWMQALPNLKATYVIDQAEPGWQGETGKLDAARIEQLAGSLDNKLVYLSGPEPMIEVFKDGLVASGASEEQIKTDYFPGYTE